MFSQFLLFLHLLPFTLDKFLYVAPQLEHISSAILPFFRASEVSTGLFQQLYNFSHLKKTPLSSPFYISFAALYHKTPGKNCLLSFCSKFSPRLIHFSQGFLSTLPEEQLLSRSPMTSMLLNPFVSSQCSPYFAFQQHLTR